MEEANGRHVLLHEHGAIWYVCVLISEPSRLCAPVDCDLALLQQQQQQQHAVNMLLGHRLISKDSKKKKKKEN